MQSRQTGCAQFLKGEFGKKLLRRRFVVVAAVGPEQLRKGKNLRVNCAIGVSVWMRHDQLQYALLAQPESRELIVDDRIDGDGCLR